MGWASRNKQQRMSSSKGASRVSRRSKEDFRLSERLVDLIAPYREQNLPTEAYKKLIAAAALAWNLSLLPEAERPAVMRQAFRSSTATDAQFIGEVIGALILRKEQLFPEDHRTIVSWEVTESEDQCHVNVASLVG